MLRIAVCLAFLAVTVIPAWAAEGDLDQEPPPEGDSTDDSLFRLIWDLDDEINLPWGGTLKHRGNMAEIVSNLVLAGGYEKDLSQQVQAFREQWEAQLEARQRAAEALAKLAAAFEEKEDFAKALFLYEKLWEEFPEQQGVIGEIKRRRATSLVQADLSTPQAALLSLKRALMTYELTAATFGITKASTILYEPEPIERNEFGKREAPVEQFEDELAAALGAEATKALKGDVRRAQEEWPKPQPDAWEYKLDLLLLGEELVSIELDDVTVLEAIEKLADISGIPTVVTPAAREVLAKHTVTFHLSDVPAKYALRELVQGCGQPLGFAQRPFYCLICSLEHDVRDDPDHFMTLVVQHEPWVLFPDCGQPPEEVCLKKGEETLQFVSGSKKKPENWFAYENWNTDLQVFTGPAQLVSRWLSACRIPESGKYYGRVWPLFQCLRAYPLPGPRVDRHTGHPKRRYVYRVQQRRQVRRMQRFLSDRQAMISLLQADLVGVKEHARNRYEPDITVGALSSRLGLWNNNGAYRFLLFDSKEDRHHWLKGRHWVDIPSDLDEHKWPTDEEWEKRLEEMAQEAERPIENEIWPRLEDAVEDEAEKTDEE